jgi:hypothetical protein
MGWEIAEAIPVDILTPRLTRYTRGPCGGTRRAGR